MAVATAVMRPPAEAAARESLVRDQAARPVRRARAAPGRVALPARALPPELAAVPERTLPPARAGLPASAAPRPQAGAARPVAVRAARLPAVAPAAAAGPAPVVAVAPVAAASRARAEPPPVPRAVAAPRERPRPEPPARAARPGGGSHLLRHADRQSSNDGRASPRRWTLRRLAPWSSPATPSCSRPGRTRSRMWRTRRTGSSSRRPARTVADPHPRRWRPCASSISRSPSRRGYRTRTASSSPELLVLLQGIDITRAGYQGAYVTGQHNTFENCSFLRQPQHRPRDQQGRRLHDRHQLATLPQLRSEEVRQHGGRLRPQGDAGPGQSLHRLPRLGKLGRRLRRLRQPRGRHLRSAAGRSGTASTSGSTAASTATATASRSAATRSRQTTSSPSASRSPTRSKVSIRTTTPAASPSTTARPTTTARTSASATRSTPASSTTSGTISRWRAANSIAQRGAAEQLLERGLLGLRCRLRQPRLAQASAPRTADGSLPRVACFGSRPAARYQRGRRRWPALLGAAPDLGAFESAP